MHLQAGGAQKKFDINTFHFLWTDGEDTETCLTVEDEGRRPCSYILL